MALNTLEYAKIFQTALDKQIRESATTGWMEANAGQVVYNGGDEIKIPKMSMTGLGDYDRDEGFPKGSVTLSYETLKMTMDRGRTFQLDAMDVNETNFVAAAGTVMGEFQRLYVVPEIDAYRYSTIYTKAAAAGNARTDYTPTAKDILGALSDDISKIQDVVGESVPLVIAMSIATRNILNQASGVDRHIDVSNFKSGDIEMKVNRFNGIPIIGASSSVMKSAFTFDAGASTSAGGFAAASGAVPIHWLIMLQTAPIAVSKTEKVRIFAPDTNQHADAWKLDYRKYHDLWIPENKLEAVYGASGVAG